MIDIELLKKLDWGYINGFFEKNFHGYLLVATKTGKLYINGSCFDGYESLYEVLVTKFNKRNDVQHEIYANKINELLQERFGSEV